MNFSKFFHHASGYSPHSQKKEDIAKIDPLFHYFYFITAFYIAKQILIYFITPGYEDKLWLITTPIAIIGAMFFLMVFGSCRIRRIEFQKHKIVRYQYWFDLLKTLIYMIFMITATEFKLLENDQVVKSTPAETEMFWFSLELALLASPTILSLRGKAANFVVLFFHFVYLYVRLEGFSDSNVEASFCLVHIIPLTIFIYRHKIQEESSHKGKVKQEEDGKFASTVLNLLPEGVAIVDEDGLQYMNNSLRTIMKVKDEECLEALFALENRQFADESAVSSAFVKKSLSLNKDNPEQQQKTLYNFKPEQNKSPYAKASENEAHSKSPKLKEHRERKRAYSSSIESSKLSRRPTKTHTPGGKKYSAFYKNVLEFGTDEAINSSGISSTKLLQNKDGLDESQKRVKESEECFSPIYSDGGLSSSFREDRSPDSPLSSPGVSSLRKKIKKILHKIEEPYKKSHHKTVKEAIADILSKMKEEFAPDTMSGVIMSLFAKIDPIMQRKMSLGQGPLGQEKKPIRIKPQSLGPNRWAIVMQSIREVAPGCLQYLEVKFTPILTNGKSALILLVRDVTEKEIIKKMEEKEKSQSLALASVSHEFRTPLNGIMGMLENLKDHISSEVTQNFVVPAYNSAKLLLTLVNDILDFHQLKEQKLVLVPVRFNLKAKLEESLSLIAIQAKARGLQLKVELDNKVPRFICNDPNRVQQVVNNLVGNAIKFTVEGSITVRAEYYSERKVLIKVIDTGIGIEQSNIEKLFKAFGKIDSKQNRELNPQGVGLGLTISNSLAKVLCSTERVSGLNVASEPNKGSTFSFVLDNVYSPEEEYVVDDDDETKNLSENIESLYRKYYKGENLVSTSVVHFPNSVTTLKELHSPNNIHRNAFTTSLAGISMSESPTKLDIPSEVDRADRVERIVRERANRANTGNGGVRKKVLRRTFVMNDNLGRIVEKLKENRGKPPLVLVIDDNEYNHLILKNFLELFEIEVHSAYNGKQGLDKIKQRTSEGANDQYMMVFIDIEMPIMDGLECTKEIKALVKSGDLTEIPLIAQSAHSEAEGAPKCLEAGMMDYIQKPIAKAKLIEMLVKWLPKEE